MKWKQHATRAFTLVELLTVIAIIGILAGFVLAAVMKVREMAWRSDTREIAFQLVAAWTAHLNDFRRFPDNAADITEMDANAIRTLNTHHRYNQNTDYMEFTKGEKLHGVNDRWGNFFQVALDAGPGSGGRDSTPGYDGRVKAGAHGVVARAVAIWSKGPDGEDGTEDDVITWELRDD